MALKPTGKKKDPDAMDIDAVIVEKADRIKGTQTRNAEQLRLMKEGRCFGCQKQGHVRRDCPERKGKGNAPPPYKPKARTIVTNEAGPLPPDMADLKPVIRSITALNDNDKESLFDSLMKEEDF
jgi:hypothetical protein